jgi:GAF domain-containing protein
MAGNPAFDVMRDAAQSLARDDALESTLLGMLQPLADRFGIGSAAVFAREGDGDLRIVSAIGLGDPAALAAAVRNPAHPVARTATERAAAFDVRPMAAGGPALRSHLPLIVGGDDGRLVGVLALAHDQPTDPDTRALAQAVADLAAVALARAHQASGRPLSLAGDDR